MADSTGNTKTAQDWVRQLRFSNQVNKQTVGVDTDKVTPQLLLASSNKLLSISRGQQEGDQKDALQFQKIYGPVEYFAQRIQKDGGSVARSMLWKATNKGNLDFIGSNSLQPHVSAIFNQSGLTRFIDNSTPLEGIDTSMLITRVGEGGISSEDVAPIQMRLVQPSYFGFVDGIRCYSEDTQIYTKKGWICVKDMNMDTEFATLVEGKPQWNKPIDVTSYDYEGPMYGYESQDIQYLVSPQHRMWVSRQTTKRINGKRTKVWGDFKKLYVQDIHQKHCRMLIDAQTNKYIDVIPNPKSGRGFYIEQYKGRIYCPTVPGGLVYVKRGKASFGIWSSNTQEKSPGITGYLTKNVMKGTDGKLYQKFYNARTGKEEYVSSVRAAKSVVTTPEYLNSKDKYIYALGGQRGVRIVKREDVDFILPRADEAWSTCANNVPMLSGIKAMRLLMGCHHPDTPVIVIDSEGYTDIVPAKRTGHLGDVYLFGCDKKGKDRLYKLRQTVPRPTERNSKFKKVVLSSGRTLLTSFQHKWYVYQNNQFQLKYADELKKGMLIPRSIFSSIPVRNTVIMGKKVTQQICILMGRIIKSLVISKNAHKITYVKNNEGVDQQPQLQKAFKQLGVLKYRFFSAKGQHAVTIKDPVFIDWINNNIGTTKKTYKIPKQLLTLPAGLTCAFLDSYYKDLSCVGQDSQGTNWLLDFDNQILRDGIAFMLTKIYTDSKYRDSVYKGKLYRALQLCPLKTTKGDIILEKISDIEEVEAPAIMIDIDCDDNVYAVANGIITHNSKYATQAVPLQQREAPLVRSLDEASGMDMPTILGKKAGSQWAPKSGIIKAVREDRIDLLYDDGTKGSVNLYKNFPANTKGWISNYVKVKAGQRVNKGQLLATSNYTDDNGVLATGRNLRVGYLSYKGGTYEDGCTISQTAAKKMAYTTMYKTSADKDKSIRNSKSLYNTWKPGQYTKQQLQNLDDNGIVKVGATINKGDPMILGIRTTEPSPGTMGKRLLTDVTEVWDHAHPGVVTDVVNTKNGIKVYATVSSPLKEGDKISALYGNKGTIAKILPDEEMPKDEKGRPLEVLFDPLGIVSRCYDKETQFLTREGWKLGKDIRDDEQLYSYNSQTNTCHWSKQIEPLYKKHYKGIMYGAKTNALDFLVTPGHRFFAKSHKDFQQVTVEQIFKQACSLPAVQNEEASVITKEVYSDSWYTLQYDDMVYCPTVDTGYVVTRRNGKVIIAHNTNPSQLMQVALGKVAQKTGKPIIVPQFMPKGVSRLKWVKDLMKQHNVPWKQNVYDPSSGRTIKNVFTGSMYFLPLKHISDTKMSARGTATYTADGVPASGGYEGSKRIGQLETAAVVGHNAFDFLVTDAKLIRGQSNADFWRSIRTGQIPTIPGEPLVHKKFFAHLQGSGMNIKRTHEGVSIFALSNKDVDQLAGHRQLKSKDTYQQKTFQQIPGGLFGKDIFGDDGQHWAYIQVDNPLPNPVMQEPLARLLRLKDKQFQAIIRGKGQFNGMKNSSDIQNALSKIDLQKQKITALKQLKEASPSRKDDALKRYVAIAKMEANGVQPADYMLNKIPVLPPKYRPITSHGGLTMVADSNYLYAQLLDARDDAREARDLPQELQQEAQSNLYTKWKQLVGLYDPSDVKLKSKNIKGLLKWALGKSPKASAFNMKVLGSTVDTVGRGVVIPSTKIKLNEIGMPIDMAWDVYQPFIVRKLVQQNYSPIDAMKMAKAKAPVAEAALKEAVQERPVVMNRAPSLHKLSLMGFNVKLTNGSAIKVNPSIVVPFGMDFDGDSVWNQVQIWFTRDAGNRLFKNSELCDLTFSNTAVNYRYEIKDKVSLVKVSKVQEKEEMFGKDTTIQLARTICLLNDLPVVEGSAVKKSDTVTEWDVQEGFYTSTVDPATGEIVLAQITKVSKHEKLKMFDCTLSVSSAYSHVVTASEDHSLITLDKNTLELVKTRPEDAVGALVPVVKKNEANSHANCAATLKLGITYPLSYNLGVFLGAMIGDGWIDSNLSTLIACSDPSLQNYIIDTWKASNNLPMKKDSALFKFKPSEGRFSDSTMDRITVYLDAEDALELKKLIGRGAENKRIAPEIMAGSKTALIGVLCGLLATDGHVGISKTASKKAPIKNVAYHTISPTLRDNIQELCMRLGIRTRVTPYMGANSKSTCYAVGFCLEDVAKLKRDYPNKFVIPVDYKEAVLQEICTDINKGVKNSFDLVPYPRGLFCEFSYVGAGTMFKGTIPAASKKGYIKREYAKKLADVMEAADWEHYFDPPYLRTEEKTGHTPEQAKALVDKWIAMVRNEDITWEVVESVTPSTVTEGWDCTVPGPYTFTLSTGTVVQDTVNLHVPVSRRAIEDIRQNMMPQKNLISMRNKKILYRPQKGYIQGLYVATRMGDASKGVQTFNTLAEAKEAYHKGIIDIDTPIVVKELQGK